MRTETDPGTGRQTGAAALGVEERSDEILTASRTAQPDAAIDGCLVAPMVTGGVETVLGVQRDPMFGPIVMFGLGGIFVEALEDVTFRAAPFDEAEARPMIEETAAYPVLTGLRGQPPADLDAVATALSRREPGPQPLPRPPHRRNRPRRRPHHPSRHPMTTSAPPLPPPTAPTLAAVPRIGPPPDNDNPSNDSDLQLEDHPRQSRTIGRRRWNPDDCDMLTGRSGNTPQTIRDTS